jgi:hypothetical protein
MCAVNSLSIDNPTPGRSIGDACFQIISREEIPPVADNKEKILGMVEAALKKNPAATTEELQNQVKKKYPSVGPLTKRQFNARYVLQIKRRKPGAGAKKKPDAKAAPRKPRTRRAAAAGRKPGRPRRTRRTAAPASAPAAERSVDRDEVRAQFLSFASDIAAAEARKDLVKVLANVDKYVDAVAKAVG